ncbi:hypothetical protein ABT272_41175 [Streptomyces sp900105245]|uniref:Uncharacterized protein n=1 Tax=Streptomyces sp. 900105245 TaxID=3154379 RepID=A0ABV1UK05_9ACTN
MIFHPWRRHEPLDHTELAQLLPAPGDPVLSDDRQRLLEDFLMSNVTKDTRPARPYRRLAIRIAAPVALAAALAGTALAVHQTTPHAASSVTANGPVTGGSPRHISNVAYTLNRASQGTVTVTIRKAGAERPNLTRLQHDLGRMGVNARVYQDDPTCALDQGEEPELGYASLKAVNFQHRNGTFTATIHPSKFPTGTHLEIVFPPLSKDSAQIDDLAFGLRNGKAPDCRHMLPSDKESPAPTVTTTGEITPDHKD